MEIIAEIIFGFFLYGTAKIILPLISFGKWRANQEKSKAGWLSGWPYYTKGADGKLYFSLEGASLIALLFWGFVGIIAVTVLK